MVQIKFLPRGEGINVYVEREILNHSVLLHPQCGSPCVERCQSLLRQRCVLGGCLSSGAASDAVPCSLSSSVGRSIIQFREVFLTPDYLAIAMEFAPGGDMFQYVKRKKGLQARAPPAAPFARHHEWLTICATAYHPLAVSRQARAKQAGCTADGHIYAHGTDLVDKCVAPPHTTALI